MDSYPSAAPPNKLGKTPDITYNTANTIVTKQSPLLPKFSSRQEKKIKKKRKQTQTSEKLTTERSAESEALCCKESSHPSQASPSPPVSHFKEAVSTRPPRPYIYPSRSKGDVIALKDRPRPPPPSPKNTTTKPHHIL